MSRAAKRAPDHSTSSGNARICGRASKCGSTIAAPRATAISAENGFAERSRNRVSSPRLIGEAGDRNQHQPAPPGGAVDRRQHNFGEPLGRGPGHPGKGVGERGVRRQRLMRKASSARRRCAGRYRDRAAARPAAPVPAPSASSATISGQDGSSRSRQDRAAARPKTGAYGLADAIPSTLPAATARNAGTAGKFAARG